MEEAKQIMELTVGAILEGKVKSITNFGAFIALPENKTGMVHISEVANTYVSDIRTFLTEGQDVRGMVIALDNGKVNRSRKRREPKPQRGKNRANSPRYPGQHRQRRPPPEPSCRPRHSSRTHACRSALRGAAEAVYDRVRQQALLSASVR